MKRSSICVVTLLIFTCFLTSTAEAKRRKRRRYGPPLAHPIVLWSKTLADSTDREQRKVAAFKLSEFSQTIYQESIINVLIKCMKDPDFELKVLCTKAMGKAGNHSQCEWVRKALLERYSADPSLRDSIVRTFIKRQEKHASVHEVFLEAAKKATQEKELTTLIDYFIDNGSGSEKLVDTLTDIYKRHDSRRVKQSVAKALGENAEGQNSAVELLSQCATDKDTPLALTCLAGLQLQARSDPRTWDAIQKTVMSDDPDMLMATLDVINALPETPKIEIAARLVEILEDSEDSEIEEKAVLALGVCGDHSEKTVNKLVGAFENKETDESVRIAAALVLGKQADSFPEKPRATLSKCVTTSKSPSLKTACDLGLKELVAREAKTAASASPRPVASPNPTAAPRTPTENVAEGDKSEE